MTTPNPKRKIKVTKNGPYLVSGGVPLADQVIVPDADGVAAGWREGKTYPAKESYALCRCGQSGGKPFCDGTHRRTGFDGTETASREPFDRQAGKTQGPELELADVPSLCAAAGFCHRAGGVWDNTVRSGDPEARKIAIQETCDCPSGRLVVRDKTGRTIEPSCEPSIAPVLEADARSEGPLWVRGGIPVEAVDGQTYQIRNRVTLCRCGKSGNKPFCDGSHVPES